MELFALIFAIFCIVTFIMPWINHGRIGGLRSDLDAAAEEIRRLRARLGKLEAGSIEASAHVEEHIEEIAQGIAQPTPPPSPVEEDEFDQPFLAPAPADSPAQRAAIPRVERRADVKDAGFEMNLAAKLPVWIGALSLICAAFFLVKYSIEAGWLGPAMRVGIGGAFGASLVAAGRWVAARGGMANHERIAQGLTGAGIVSLYFSLYAAVNLYTLLPPLAGFAGMAAVTALAVVLSLHHGQPIAVFGMLGGLLTPALVGSDDPDAMTLFAYLFLLFCGMLAVMARRGWWVLAAVALSGMFLWSGLWFGTVFRPEDSLALVLFAVALCAAVLTATHRIVIADEGGSALPVHVLNLVAVAGAALTILWLGTEVTLSLFDWTVLGLLSAGCMGLAFFRPQIYGRALWAKLAADLLLLLSWAGDVPAGSALAAVAGIAVIFIVLPRLVMFRSGQEPLLWAGMQLAASIALYVIAYSEIDLPNGIWGASSLVLAALAVWQAREMRLCHGDDSRLMAVYAVAATSFISLGLAIELPWSYVPAALAAQAAATLWIGGGRSDLAFLRNVAAGLAVVFIALNWEQFSLFADLAVNSLFGDVPAAWTTAERTLLMPSLMLGVPALCMGLSLLLSGRWKDTPQWMRHLFFGAALLFALAAAYYGVRGIFQPNENFFAFRAGFIERSFITLLIAGVEISIIHFADRLGMEFSTIWGRILFHAAMLRIFWFDLLVCNPYFNDSQHVGVWPLLNGVTLTYGAGLALSLWAARAPAWNVYAGVDFVRKTYKGYALLLLFAFSSLTVRHVFHPDSMASSASMGNAEFYSYSAAWLLAGLALLAFGIARKNRLARMGSLAFMLLAVAKVFLFDAAELEGLLRVFSFLGLGLSLIGLSFFYTRFIGAKDHLKE